MDLIRHADGFPVAGPDATSQFSGRSPLTAVRFEPGLGPPFFGVDASELTDRRVPLDDLWPSCRVRLLAVRAEDDPVAALVDAVRGAVDAHDPMAALALALASGTAVSEVAATLGWSDRTLRRRSARAYGYGPKTLSRVLRFRRDRSRSRSAVPRTRPRVSSSKCTGLDQRCKCRVDRFGGPQSKVSAAVLPDDGSNSGSKLRTDSTVSHIRRRPPGRVTSKCGTSGASMGRSRPSTCGRLERFGHVIRTRRTRSLG